MNLSWYYKRLVSMSPGEMAWRVRKLTWQLMARMTYRRSGRQYDRNIAPSTRLVEMMGSVRFFGVDRQTRDQCPPEWIQSSVDRAEFDLRHQLDLFALGRIDLGPEIRFNHEYKRHIDTPLAFAPWLDYRDTDRLGDFKYFWEVPRLQHLIPPAKAYFLTQDTRYAVEVESQLTAFWKQCPYLVGVNWIMPMETGIRLISLCWIASFLKDYLRERPSLCGLIEQLILSHVHYTTRNYAAYSSANNHLIGEVVGVFLASLCFGNLPGMKDHLQTAHRILCREITHQFYSDGVNREQGMHYQIFCYDMFLMAWLLGKQNGLSFPDEYQRVLERSAEFITATAWRDGSWLHIGDSDDGRAVLLAEEGSEVRSLAATSAVLFGRKTFASAAGSLDQKTFWLIGADAFLGWNAAKCDGSNAPLPSHFPDGGYTVLRSDHPAEIKIVFDCGPLGFESIAAHGHADSLSFTLEVDGRPFFIDPGTYIYSANDPYRNYFRSTRAHNTVVIDGEDQSRMAGPFLWSRKAESVLELWNPGPDRDCVVGRHHGYQSLDDPVIHRRTMELDKRQGMVRVQDDLECRELHRVEQWFHLHPECRAEILDSHRIRIAHSGRSIELILDPETRVQTLLGNDNPIAGWASSRYDEKVKSLSIAASADTGRKKRFVLEIHTVR